MNKLQEVRENARKNSETSSAVMGSKQNRELIKTMLSSPRSINKNSSSSSKPSSYAAACSSFVHGCKRPAPNHAGHHWHNMTPMAMTKELKDDIAVLQNRGTLDPKRFYKKTEPVGKFVQVGTVVEGPSEYFSARLTKKQRKSSLLDEILADKAASGYAKNKFKTMQQERSKGSKRGVKSRR